MNKRSPFPGMDPHLEAHWHDAHCRLLNQISDQIFAQLPEDLILSIEIYNLGEGTKVMAEELPHRYLEIRSVSSGRSIITVIEVLSPANKSRNRSGREYLQKRESYLQSKVNFVEIDLLRKGGAMLNFNEDNMTAPPYLVFVKRFNKSPEIYGISYQDTLPRFRVPLRPKDLPVILDLQSAIDDCYRVGQYWKRIDYQNDKLSPKPSEEFAQWLDSVDMIE